MRSRKLVTPAKHKRERIDKRWQEDAEGEREGGGENWGRIGICSFFLFFFFNTKYMVFGEMPWGVVIRYLRIGCKLGGM